MTLARKLAAENGRFWHENLSQKHPPHKKTTIYGRWIEKNSPTYFRVFWQKTNKKICWLYFPVPNWALVFFLFFLPKKRENRWGSVFLFPGDRWSFFYGGGVFVTNPVPLFCRQLSGERHMHPASNLTPKIRHEKTAHFHPPPSAPVNFSLRPSPIKFLKKIFFREGGNVK